MIKQIFIMAILTAIAIYFFKEFAAILHALGHAQTWLTYEIYRFFPASHMIRLICNIATLVILPLLLGLIPAFIYWLIEHREMPKLIEVIWVIWVILLLVFVLYKA